MQRASGPRKRANLLAATATSDKRLVAACGEKGVKGLVVITAGFRETGGAGIAREAELKDLGPAWSARSKPKHPGLESVEIEEASFTRKSAGAEPDDEGA